MGSSGTGRLSDYSNFGGYLNPANKPKGKFGSEGPEDKCALGFSTELEDVLTSEYYIKYKTIPAKGTLVKIKQKMRIVAVDDSDLVIGNLPTKYNYLLRCMNDGFEYEGEVEESVSGLIPLVIIAVSPK